MQRLSLILLVLFGGLSLCCGFIYGTPQLEQLCECLLLLSFLCYTKKGSYENIIIAGFCMGASYELIDEIYLLNQRLSINDYVFTGFWLTFTAIRLLHKRTTKWK